jgi:hypothetical protein
MVNVVAPLSYALSFSNAVSMKSSNFNLLFFIKFSDDVTP